MTCPTCFACGDEDHCDPCWCPYPGDDCRTGCKTLDHLSYGECLRAASIQIGNLK